MKEAGRGQLHSSGGSGNASHGGPWTGGGPSPETLAMIEHAFYSNRMSSLVYDLRLIQAAGLAGSPAPGWRLTAGQEATSAAELRQAVPG